MVLDTAAFDNSPASDFDPYVQNATSSPSQSSNGALHIDLSKASRPFPFLGPLLGFNQAQLVKMTSDVAREAPRIIARPLTQDEVDAVVTSVSKYAQVHSWIYANALIFAGFKAQSTRKEMGFPLGFPTGKIFKNLSINFDKFGPLTGPLSRAAWNTVRTTVWMAWWGLPAYIVGGVVGQMAMAQTQMADKRLKQFQQDMGSESSRARLNAAVQRRQSGLPQQPVTQTQQDDDGMNPQLGSETVLDKSEDRGRRGVEEFMRSSPKEPSPQSSTGEPQLEPSKYRFQSPDERSQALSAAEQSSNMNASGGSAWDRIRNQAGQNESAWDRVRRGSGQGEQQVGPDQWQSRDNVPLTDSFTFDERDEDRHLAKTEAQREFDQRVERERQGKDFSEGKGGGKKW
jgi:hypothetical protein